jgi:hypothetical protein
MYTQKWLRGRGKRKGGRRKERRGKRRAGQT